MEEDVVVDKMETFLGVVFIVLLIREMVFLLEGKVTVQKREGRDNVSIVKTIFDSKTIDLCSTYIAILLVKTNSTIFFVDQVYDCSPTCRVLD